MNYNKKKVKMGSIFPPDIVFNIFKYLDLNDISNLYLINKKRYECLKDNEKIIFKNIYKNSIDNKLLKHTYFHRNNFKVVKNNLSKRFGIIKNNKNNIIFIYANKNLFYIEKTNNSINIIEYYFKTFLNSIIIITRIINDTKLYSYCLTLDNIKQFIKIIINRKNIKKKRLNNFIKKFIVSFILYFEDLYIKLENVYLYINDNEDEELKLMLKLTFEELLIFINESNLIKDINNYDYNLLRIQNYDIYDDLDYFDYYDINRLF